MSRRPPCSYIENEHQCWALIFLTSTPSIHCYIDFLEPALAMLWTGPNIPYNLSQLRLQLIENVDYIMEGYLPSLSQRGCQCMWHSHYFHLRLRLPGVLHHYHVHDPEAPQRYLGNCRSKILLFCCQPWRGHLCPREAVYGVTSDKLIAEMRHKP